MSCQKDDLVLFISSGRWMLLAFLIAMLVGDQLADTPTEWSAYKTKHNKYFGQSEDIRRRAIWAKNREWIIAHNARADKGLETYRLGENHYTDHSKDDLKWLLGYVLQVNTTLNTTGLDVKTFTPAAADDVRAELPLSLDYSATSDCIGPVEDQGKCGSCWAFATIGVLQYCHCKKNNNGQFINLSKQELISCGVLPPYFLTGCRGGYFLPAFRFMHDVGLLPTTSYIPSSYRARATLCHPVAFLASAKKVFAKGLIVVPGNESIIALALLTLGPLAVSIHASTPTFTAYSSGVYNDPACSGAPNHAVLLVGYGVNEIGQKYWIIKNEWGTNWGMNGYMWMARGVNMCAITRDVQTTSC